MSSTKPASRDTEPNIRTAANYGSIFGGQPFHWNTTTNKLENGSRAQRSCWLVNVTATLLYTFLVMVQSIRVTMDSEATVLDNVYSRIMLSFWLIGALLIVTVIKCFGFLPVFTNLVVAFGNEFEESYVLTTQSLKGHKMYKLCNLFQKFVFYSFASVLVLMVTKAFARPADSDLPGSLLPAHLAETLGVRLVSSLFAGLMVYVYHSSGLIAIHSGIKWVFQTIIILKELGAKSSSLTGRALQKEESLSKIWSVLKIQNGLFNEYYTNPAIVGFQFMGMYSTSYCIYAVIRMEGLPKILFGTMALAYASILFSLFMSLAELYESSKKQLREWKTNSWMLPPKKYKIFSRKLRSWTEVKVAIGSSYYVDKSLLMTILDIVICNTVALLMLK